MPWRVIEYREFYDVPRMIVARNGEEMFLFHSRFNEDMDEYVDHYEVYRLPDLTTEALGGSWKALTELAIERMPSIGLNSLPFTVERVSP